MLLEARKLDKSFNGVYALKGLDLSLKEGGRYVDYGNFCFFIVTATGQNA